MLPLKLQRSQVGQALVWPFGVVVASPVLDDHACLASVAEPFEVQAFVPEASVERLVRTILPRLTGVDVRGIEPHTWGYPCSRQRNRI